MRLVIVIACLFICVSGIVSIFWYQEMKYRLPTPVPVNFKKVPILSKVTFRTEAWEGPSFLHFYNPDCPCSRFNANHVNKLIREHGDSIEFVIVVPAFADLAEAKSKFGESLNFVVDSEKSIANACGVYSTPQAVILTEDNILYFRGNYNKSRYCTNQASNYAELALLSFIHHQPPPVLELSANLSYGCELPDQSNSIAEIF